MPQYSGIERRKFVRFDYNTPLAYKVCSKDTLNKLLDGYTSNVSQTGIHCRIKNKVENDDVLWLSFDRAALDICREIEKDCLIYQAGIVGKVVRVEHNPDGSYGVGLRFITRQEKNESHIYSKIYFLEHSLQTKNEKA